MAQANIESDPLFNLLTDALRAGPGSPEWRQAVVKMRETGRSDSDEYKLLAEAREHLESGREYKSVRAGAGFTRRLFQGIEREGNRDGERRTGLPTANLIAIFSALAILGLLAFLAYSLIPRGGTDVPHEGAAELGNAFFPTEAAVARFENGMPAGWHTVGELPLAVTKNALRPAAAGPITTTAPVAGGLVSAITIGPDDPFAAEATLRLGRASDDVIIEVFVSTEDELRPDPKAVPNELVWLLQGKTQRVVLSGQKQAETERPRGDAEQDGSASGVPVRIRVNREFAVVEVNRQRVWSGPHGLAAQPRHIGVRFIRTGKPPDDIGVTSIAILKK